MGTRQIVLQTKQIGSEGWSTEKKFKTSQLLDAVAEADKIVNQKKNWGAVTPQVAAFKSRLILEIKGENDDPPFKSKRIVRIYPVNKDFDVFTNPRLLRNS